MILLDFLKLFIYNGANLLGKDFRDRGADGPEPFCQFQLDEDDSWRGKPCARKHGGSRRIVKEENS